MRARFTEDQELLRRSVREFLEAECPVSAVRAWTGDGERPGRLPDAIWKRMAGLGWPGLAVPEAAGGAGLGLVELAILLEEAGRTLLPGPLFSSALFGGVGLARAASAAQRDAWLPGVADGTLRVALALAERGGDFDDYDPRGVALRAERDGDGVRLHGRKGFVLDADSADRLLVAARGAGGLVLALVDPEAAGVALEPVALVDTTRSFADVAFAGARVDAGDVLAPPAGAGPALDAILAAARVGVAAELCGIARRVLELSVAFAKTREQFGQPIGRFQAIQHKCADMLVRTEGAWSATYWAAWAVDRGEADAAVAASMAKAAASEAAVFVTGQGLQIHGGLGFSWEQDPQLYWKRARVSSLWLGDAAWHLDRVANATLG